MNPEKRFYVYTLTDPRDRSVFYVGKGTGRRLKAHEMQAKRLDLANPRKVERIREILKAGLRPVAEIQIDHLDESDAFQKERELIEFHGESLTNISHGQHTSRDRARVMLANLKPFEQWNSERAWEPIAIKCYWAVKENLEEMASGIRQPRTHRDRMLKHA